jgi:hypothetical protein
MKLSFPVAPVPFELRVDEVKCQSLGLELSGAVPAALGRHKGHLDVATGKRRIQHRGSFQSRGMGHRRGSLWDVCTHLGDA